jgi:putative intracellular protease/amidase
LRHSLGMFHIAIVVSSVGFHWEEVFRPYWEFKKSGCAVTFYSVDGSPARPDPLSVAVSGAGALVGLGVRPHLAPATKRGHALRAALDEIAPLAQLDADRFDALYLPGGHGCLFDVNRSATLHEVILRMYARRCLLSAVCHATSTFAYVRVDHRSIVAGHALTGFPRALDRVLIVGGLVCPEFLPLPLVNDDELRRAGARLSLFDEAKAVIDPMWTRVSLPFITGVGPKAAGRVARAVVRHLEGRGREWDSGMATTTAPETPVALEMQRAEARLHAGSAHF